MTPKQLDLEQREHDLLELVFTHLPFNHCNITYSPLNSYCVYDSIITDSHQRKHLFECKIRETDYSSFLLEKSKLNNLLIEKARQNIYNIYYVTVTPKQTYIFKLNHTYYWFKQYHWTNADRTTKKLKDVTYLDSNYSFKVPVTTNDIPNITDMVSEIFKDFKIPQKIYEN